MRIPIYFLLLFISLTPLIPNASAIINVTPMDIGNTYIHWNWTPEINLIDMYIDGNIMCGYDTTADNFTLTDLNPGELHTIIVLTATDTGSNSTYTNGTYTPAAIVGGGSGGVTQDGGGVMWLVYGLVGGIIAIVFFITRL